MDSPERILDEIAALWAASRQDYRDARLRVGEMAAAYALAVLRSARGLPEHQRSGITRARATATVAQRLGVTVRRVNELIHVAMAARLLVGPPGLGRLCWASIRCFRPAVRRRRFTRDAVWRRKGEPPPGVPLPEDRESWELVPHTAQRATDLFRRAVAEGWPLDEVQSATRQLRRGMRHPATHGRAARDLDVFALARSATPRDLAEMLALMVQQSADPAAVAGMLAGRLDSLTVPGGRARGGPDRGPTL